MILKMGSLLFIEIGVCVLMLLMICVDSNERLLIDGRNKIAQNDNDFICATIDWWPPERCDYGDCSWDNSSLLNVDLNNTIFKNAIKAFSPLKIRLGGTLQDKVIYQTKDHQEPCNPFIKNESEIFGFTKGCLPLSRWDELNTFIQETRAIATFGLNVLTGKTVLANGSTIGAWDSTNAETLIRYTVQKKYTIYGWELGNEVSANGIEAVVSASQYAIDTINLHTMMQRIYKAIKSKPLIIAPSGFFTQSSDQIWYKEFLDKTHETLNVISHHIYNLGSGVDQNLTEKILDPSYLDGVAYNFKNLKLTINTSASNASAWVTEAGGVFNSGQNNVSNTFVFSFWYLDQLGMSSVYDTKTYCRQTLIGGNYGLLDTTTFKPNPDYYSALLWHRLMGKNVLATRFLGTKKIRAYSHCAKESKGITVLLMNLDNSKSFDVNLSVNSTWRLHKHRSRTDQRHPTTKHAHKTKTGGKTTVIQARQEYHLTPKDGDLHSRVMMLNGKELTISKSRDIPLLEPFYTNSSEPITIAPYSIVFAHIPHFNLHACRS